MIPLTAPPAIDDDDCLTDICTDASWSPHQAAWLACYANYRQFGGNPWIVAPVTFTPDVHDAQYHLYDSRRSSRRLREIRETPGLLCCPMCGSLTTGGLDHFLPRAVFPEFSIMAANLVPACSHCNTGAKGDTYRGNCPERFIHPYFDTLAQTPIWQIEIIQPYEAATFKAAPLAGLTKEQATIVGFHLDNVLGAQFSRTALTLWSTLPQRMRDAISGTITLAGASSEVGRILREYVVTTGRNSWHSAFFRGLQGDAQAMQFIADGATLLTPTPLL